VRWLTLTRRFAAISLLAVVAIGLLSFVVVERVVQRQATAEAARAAELLSGFVGNHLPPDVFAAGLSAVERPQFDRAAAQADGGAGLLSMRLYGPGGRVVYDSAGDFEGQLLPVVGHLAGAYEGKTEADVETAGNDHPAGAGELLEVYTPVRLGGGQRVDGALEVYLSYDATRARAEEAVRRVALVLAGGLALLWLLMWQLSRRVSRRLQLAAAHSEHQARQDPLTGLPNRRMLLDEAQRALDVGGAALLLLDLNRFKDVNDALGHNAGDALLQQVGPHLAGLLPTGGTLARLGGDEFGLLLPGVIDGDQALLVAAAVAKAFERPFLLGEVVVEMEASIGVAVAAEQAADALALLQHADVAMYAAKQDHRGVAAYEPEAGVSTLARMELLADLRRALAAEDQLRLDYQPVVRLGTGAVEGVEALLRWTHPQRGEVAPADFVPLAERTGLVRPLTRHVLDLALSQCRAWLDDGLRLSVAVNLSARNLAEPDLPAAVGAALSRHQVPAELVVLEITESAVIDDAERAEDVVRRLVALGVSVSLDDFGTGYSSMATLMRLPLGSLKVDRSFVAGLSHTDTDTGAVITTATVRMAHELGLEVVAEGVETQAQLERLRELGCDFAQGFLLSRPLPAAQVAAFAAAAPIPGAAPVPRSRQG
jgi:diguanylate cyclase (GGDEF)-like protein